MNAERAGNIGGRPPGSQHSDYLGFLGFSEPRLAPATTALRLCALQAGPGSFPEHGALEFGNGTQHLHHHSAGRPSGIDGFGQ